VTSPTTPIRAARWLALMGAGIAAFGAAPALLAGPVVCTTTLEAPPAGSIDRSGRPPAPPVEVTRCGPVTTTAELLQQRFFTWSSPFARGVSVPNQVASILGIAMGGVEGNRVMGFGFPDQAATWDATAVGNTTAVLLEQQGTPMPWRTADVPNGFSGSLGALPSAPAPSEWQQDPPARYGMGFNPPVRGLW
jgi:hypothetical protein